jgi:hypothetical protein
MLRPSLLVRVPTYPLTTGGGVQGKRDGVDIVAIVASDGLVWTAWPRDGSPGVVKNKPEDR